MDKLAHETTDASIIEAFIEEFQYILLDEDPCWEEMKMAFDWLREEAKNATCFTNINTLNRCRRLAESAFCWKVKNERRRVWKESKKVNRELMKRFETLRTTRKSMKGKLPVFEAHREEEKVPPSK